MMRTLSGRSSLALVLVVVLWQASSCCCCLGGAVTPSMTPVPPSTEMARQLRDRLNQARRGNGPFEVEVTDQELTSYVIGLLQSGAGEFPARDMQIRFGAGYVEIWATFIDVAPTDIPTYVRGTVGAVDGNLVFQIKQANASVFPIPGALREMIAQTLSESLAEVQLGLEIDRVETLPGKMVMAGRITGTPPELP